MEKILVVQVKNNSKQVDDFQLFEINIRSLHYTNESLIIKERNLWPTDKPETHLRDRKLDKLFVRFLCSKTWNVNTFVFINLKELELLKCHIEKQQRAMIRSNPIIGNTQQNALWLPAE